MIIRTIRDVVTTDIDMIHIDRDTAYQRAREFLKLVIKTNKGDEKSLADDEEFAKVIKQMERQLGTQLPSITMFNRPAESMRMIFEAAKSENTKSLIDRGAEENQYVQRLRDVFEDSPLPDFDSVKHFFPPAGGFITSDETGTQSRCIGTL